MTTEESTLPPFNTSSSDDVTKTTNSSNWRTDHINFQQKVEDEWDDFTTSLLTENSDKVEPWPHADFSKCRILLSQPEVSEKMEPWEDGTPARRHYYLPEAANILIKNSKHNIEYNEDALLAFGGMSQIEICICAPNGIDFLPVDKSGDDSKGTTWLAPEFLTLYPHYCEQIRNNANTKQSDFDIAYRINFGKPLLLDIRNLNPQFNDQQYTWRAFKNDQKHCIELLPKQQLFIRHDELIRFIEYKNSINDLQVSSLEAYNFKLEKHTSQKLLILNDVAQLHWENATPENENDFNEIHKKVLADLTAQLKQCNLRKEITIKAAANIICPEHDFDHFDTKRDKDDKDVKRVRITGCLYPTNQFSALVDASQRFWSKCLTGVRVSKTVANTEVSNWLIKEHMFIPVRAQAGAQIIRPENAPKGAPKKTTLAN